MSDPLAVLLDAHWLFRTDDGVFHCSADDWTLAPDGIIAEGDRVYPFTQHIADSLRAAGVTLAALRKDPIQFNFDRGWNAALDAVERLRVAAPPSDAAAPLLQPVCECSVCRYVAEHDVPRSEDECPHGARSRHGCDLCACGPHLAPSNAAAPLREAAEWALAYIADPDGLSAERERVQRRLRAALTPEAEA